MRIIPKGTIILGYTGTGKSTFCKEKIIKSKLAAGSRVLVITPHDMDPVWDDVDCIDLENQKEVRNFTGLRRFVATKNVIELLNDRANGFRNGLIVFDDCKSYIPASIDMELHNLLISRKQRGLDTCVVVHGFTDVPPKFYTFCSEFVLFKTTDKLDRVKRYIQKYNQVEKMQQVVNQESDKDIHYYKIFKA